MDLDAVGRWCSTSGRHRPRTRPRPTSTPADHGSSTATTSSISTHGGSAPERNWRHVRGCCSGRGPTSSRGLVTRQRRPIRAGGYSTPKSTRTEEHERRELYRRCSHHWGVCEVSGRGNQLPPDQVRGDDRGWPGRDRRWGRRVVAANRRRWAGRGPSTTSPRRGLHSCRPACARRRPNARPRPGAPRLRGAKREVMVLTANSDPVGYDRRPCSTTRGWPAAGEPRPAAAARRSTA